MGLNELKDFCDVSSTPIKIFDAFAPVLTVSYALCSLLTVFYCSFPRLLVIQFYKGLQ